MTTSTTLPLDDKRRPNKDAQPHDDGRLDNETDSSDAVKFAADTLAGAMYAEFFSDRERAELAMHHPLLTGAEILPTRPIFDVFKMIKMKVMLHETGCCFAAPSGSGKSSAMEMVVTMLHMQLPNLPIYVHVTPNQQLPSIRAFFKDFLATVHHPERKGETSDLRQRLVDSIADDARISGYDMAVLMIDEAQMMGLQDFKFLKDVSNQLSKRRVSLIPVLMGQSPEMEQLQRKLERHREVHLVSRFCMRVAPFPSFDREEDLVSIMKSIDEACYPAASSISWTAFFLPQACQHGFKLQNEAHNFMRAILDVAPTGARGTFSFPARQMFFAIRRFLLNAAKLDGPDFRAPPNAWQDAVFEAGLNEAIRLLGSDQPSKDPEVEV